MSAAGGTQKEGIRQLKYKKIPLKDLEFTEGDTVSCGVRVGCLSYIKNSTDLYICSHNSDHSLVYPTS